MYSLNCAALYTRTSTGTGIASLHCIALHHSSSLACFPCIESSHSRRRRTALDVPPVKRNRPSYSIYGKFVLGRYKKWSLFSVKQRTRRKMRVYLLCWALLVALVGTCFGEMNDDTINIDEMANPDADGPAEMMLLEASGEAPNGMTTDDEDLATDIEGSGDLGNEIGNGDMSFTTVSSKITTSNNKIPENPLRPKTTMSNGLGPIYSENELRNKNENGALGGKPDVDEEPQNFFKMIFENPAILAGMVGAVVLILLTVVLLFLFVIYRIKKKDEGSYSLDEPHKVKDPTAYWKDTKEFYA